MDPEAARLRIVDAETGELHETCPNCARLEDQLVGAENNVRSMRAQMANMKRELAGELDKESKLFPEAIALFRYWQERCSHPRAEFTPERMKALLPMLKRHGPALCREAIRGAAYDPYITTLKNGNTKRHDGWELIFANEGKFQSFREREPEYDGRNVFKQERLVKNAKRIAERVLERARLITDPKSDPVSIAHLLIEINRLNMEWRQSVELGAPMEEDELTINVEIFEGKDGWRVRLTGDNGEPIATTEVYDSKSNAERSAESIKSQLLPPDEPF